MLAAVFLIVAVILFVLSIFLPDGRLVPAGLAFFAGSFLAGSGIL